MPVLSPDIAGHVYQNSTASSIPCIPSSDTLSSYSHTRQRANQAFESVYEILKEHQEPNWDGDNATPVSQEACSAALRFLAMLPLTMPFPDLAAEPDGSIAMEWHISSSRTFLVSLSGRKVISYAGVFDKDAETYGKEPFEDSIPSIIISNIQRL